MFFSNSIANKKGFLPRPAPFRGWTGGAGREAGSWQGDAVQTGITTMTIRALSGGSGSLAGPAAMQGNITISSVGYANAIAPEANETAYLATVNQRVAPETRPVNVSLPVCMYLGLHT